MLGVLLFFAAEGGADEAVSEAVVLGEGQLGLGESGVGVELVGNTALLVVNRSMFFVYPAWGGCYCFSSAEMALLKNE